jgi:hypothetical protein
VSYVGLTSSYSSPGRFSIIEDGARLACWIFDERRVRMPGGEEKGEALRATGPRGRGELRSQHRGEA